MRQYSETARKNRSGERQAGMVPADTRISITYMASQQDGCVYLILRTNNETRIKVRVRVRVKVGLGSGLGLANPHANPNPNPNPNPHQGRGHLR